MLQRATQTLDHYGIEDPRLEAELLLRHLLKLDRARFYADLGQELTAEQIEHLNGLIQRRTRHEPMAYIIGYKEVFGIEFYVDRRVLIPRPETESLVEQTLELANSHPRPCLIADVGTGCGAIAIALASNLPQTKVYATDISAPALEVAAINCQRHGVGDRVFLLQGNLLEPIPELLDLIVANLPYVKNSDIAELSAEIKLFEPLLALAGGADGLKWIRKLLSQAKDKLRPNGAIVVEVGYDQGTAVTDLARGLIPGAEVRIVPDLSGHDRVAIIENS